MMKKLLSVIMLLVAVTGIAKAETDISGTYTESTSGQYCNSSSEWVDFTCVGDVTVAVDGTTATFTGLLNNTSNVLTATIDSEAGTLTFAKGQTVYYDSYDWELGYDDNDTESDLVGTINADGTITLDGLNIFYSGYSYFWQPKVTLTPKADPATPMSWTVKIVNAPSGTAVTIGGANYTNGDVYEGTVGLQTSDITVAEIEGYTAIVTLDSTNGVITVAYVTTPSAFTPALPENTVLKVGDTVAATMTPATSADDNDHWYLVTQTRVQSGDATATPMYDNGVGKTLYRASTDVTPASLSGQLTSDNTKYLVRFVPCTDNSYRIQFADGNFIQNTLTTGDYTTAGAYMFYNINGEEGHFAWNLTTDYTTYGSIVDNNGAGYTMAFWDSGEVTWTGGNNDWNLYEVSFEPATFSKVTFSATDMADGDTFTVTANGTEIESGADVCNGSTIKVTAVAGSGRAVSSVTVGGEEVTLSKNAYSFTLASDVDITATFYQMPVINYTLTDAAGNEYTGSYNAAYNGDDTESPTFTGAEGATIEKTFAEKDGEYTLTGTITFEFPVSSESVKNATAIQSQNGSSLWYANENSELIADNSDNYAATYETQQNYNWYIYPCFADGAFTFKIYNIGAEKWIPAAASTSKSTATVLTAEETEAGQFAYLKVVSGNGFASDLTSRNYLCVENSGAGQYVYLRNMKTNSKNTGANLTFPEAVSIDVPTGISDINTVSTANGKYLDGNKIVIVKNGKKFNAAGMSIK